MVHTEFHISEQYFIYTWLHQPQQQKVVQPRTKYSTVIQNTQ